MDVSFARLPVSEPDSFRLVSCSLELQKEYAASHYSNPKLHLTGSGKCAVFGMLLLSLNSKIFR
jgi:hypothetical protein